MMPRILGAAFLAALVALALPAAATEVFVGPLVVGVEPTTPEAWAGLRPTESDPDGTILRVRCGGDQCDVLQDPSTLLLHARVLDESSCTRAVAYPAGLAVFVCPTATEPNVCAVKDGVRNCAVLHPKPDGVVCYLPEVHLGDTVVYPIEDVPGDVCVRP